jgi:hypothetical protein
LNVTGSITIEGGATVQFNQNVMVTGGDFVVSDSSFVLTNASAVVNGSSPDP